MRIKKPGPEHSADLQHCDRSSLPQGSTRLLKMKGRAQPGPRHRQGSQRLAPVNGITALEEP